MAESTLLFNKAPYENVIVLGHVQDENGQKMSQESKGNAVDPFDALQTLRRRRYPLVFLCTAVRTMDSEEILHGKAVCLKASVSLWERSGIPMRSSVLVCKY